MKGIFISDDGLKLVASLSFASAISFPSMPICEGKIPNTIKFVFIQIIFISSLKKVMTGKVKPTYKCCDWGCPFIWEIWLATRDVKEMRLAMF